MLPANLCGAKPPAVATAAPAANEPHFTWEVLCLQVLYGGWPESSTQEEGPQRYGRQAATWHRVEELHSLSWLLGRADYVIPGVPLLFVTAQGTDFRERFLAGEVPLL